MKIFSMQLGMLGTNCYFLCDEEAHVCAVIDPGATGSKVAAFAAERGFAIDKILLTHAHFDHVGGLAALHNAVPGAPIYVHALDTDEALNMSHGKLIYTDTYADGDALTVGAICVRVLHTPGHTQGSVCLVAENAIFTGDTLFAGACGRTDFAGGSFDGMLASLKRLGELPGDYNVYPGHDAASTLERERRTNPYLREAMAR